MEIRQTEESSGLLRIGEWLVNPALDTILRAGETHKLEPRTMRLLLFLADSGGGVVSVDRLLAEVWTGVVVSSASVYQAVSQLRRLLGDVGSEATYIATVPRKGYRLVAPVSRVMESPAAEPTMIPPVAAGKRPWRTPVLGGVALLTLIVVGMLTWRRLQAPVGPTSGQASIVVLPFIDMSSDSADQSFCDGLTEELSSWLAQIPTLRVVARTSAFAFRGKGEDVRKIGKALDTDHVLEGSMRRSGDHFRVTVQLIDARNGYHLWSESFDRPMDDTITMQEDISRSVANVLKVRLTVESDRQFAARRSTDPQAYDTYLLGHYNAQQLTPESTDRAIELYRQVITADRNFAPAYTQLARAYLNRGWFRDLPIADVAAQMEPLIDSALRLDDRFSAAYAVRGALRAAQSRDEEGLADLHHAIALNPSDMSAWAEVGRIQLTGGIPREAIKSYDHAAALDPLNHTLQDQRCVALEDLAQYEAARSACDRARVLQPTLASSAETLAWLAESQGHIPEALHFNAASIKAEPSQDIHLYIMRATLYLTLNLASRAHSAVELGRSATQDEESANFALLRVVFCESGPEAMRAFLESSHLEQSTNAVALFETAYARLLLGDAAAVKTLLARAVAAPDRPTGYGEAPWYARGAGAFTPAYRIDLAMAELALGDRTAAAHELNIVLAMIDTMLANGVERNATFELRARIHALDGHPDDAIRDLKHAVRLGWRRAWWAIHEPYFTSLRSRSDFQALMTQVSTSNDKLARDLPADGD